MTELLLVHTDDILHICFCAFFLGVRKQNKRVWAYSFQI